METSNPAGFLEKQISSWTCLASQLAGTNLPRQESPQEGSSGRSGWTSTGDSSATSASYCSASSLTQFRLHSPMNGTTLSHRTRSIVWNISWEVRHDPSNTYSHHFFPLSLIQHWLLFHQQRKWEFTLITIWSFVISTSGYCPYWCVCPKTWQVHWYAVGDTALPHL